MRLERRDAPPASLILLSIGLVVGLMALSGSVLIYAAGAPVWASWGAMFNGAFGSKLAITETLTRATPLMFTGLACALAFRSRLWNIGAEGQLYAGALAVAALGSGAIDAPSVVLIPLLMFAAALAGAAMLLGPALLKRYMNVDDVVTTLLLNFIMALFVSIMIQGPMRDPLAMGWPQTMNVLDAATLDKLIAQSRLHTGLLHALLTVPMAQSQHVTGLGITLLATSLASFIYRLTVPAKSTPPTIMPFQPVDLPFLNAPFLAATAPTYLALGLAAVVAYVLWRTPLGLAIRMAGEHPQGAQAQGISVLILRTGCVMVGSAIMALGGAFLSLAAFNSFVINMVQGRGWMALALVVFGAWRPGLALLGALLYAWFDAYQLRLQHVFPGVPYQIFLMAPYVLSIAVLIPMSRRASGPQALMMPFVKGER